MILLYLKVLRERVFAKNCILIDWLVIGDRIYLYTMRQIYYLFWFSNYSKLYEIKR